MRVCMRFCNQGLARGSTMCCPVLHASSIRAWGPSRSTLTANGGVQHAHVTILLVEAVGDLVGPTIVAHVLACAQRRLGSMIGATPCTLPPRCSLVRAVLACGCWLSLTHDADGRVALHLLIDGLAQRLPHHQLLLGCLHHLAGGPGSPASACHPESRQPGPSVGDRTGAIGAARACSACILPMKGLRATAFLPVARPLARC